MSASEPISDQELARLFQSTLRFPFALAVSGGADSMALMHLVARWMHVLAAPKQLSNGRESVLVLTVDHQLRPQSGEEARWVNGEAERLGFRQVTLTWEGPKPQSGVQAAAREARYRLMHAYLNAEVREHSGSASAAGGMRDLVTGHHQDDQAETFLMRLARGSGIDGLSAMPLRATIFDVQVVRPLLGVAKERLLATLTAGGHRWIEDPSNEKIDFERVRVRKAREALSAIGLCNDSIALSARRIARGREALEAATSSLGQEAGLDLHRGAYAELKCPPFLAAPTELRVRLMARLLSMMGSQEHLVRLSQIEDLVTELESGAHQGVTLGGCIVSAVSGALYVFREPGRTSLPVVDLVRGEAKIWDGRFRVALSDAEGGPESVRVGALGASSHPELEGLLATEVWPHRALVSLPAFWEGESLLAVPHLGFVAPRYGAWARRNPAGFLVQFQSFRD
jgi:tRNA(Ile)-lysidine synthase